MTTYLDNALVQTKDALIDNIDHGDYERLSHILSTMVLLKLLFTATDYCYKGEELCGRAIGRLTDLYNETPPQAKKKREKLSKLSDEFNGLAGEYRQLHIEHFKR